MSKPLPKTRIDLYLRKVKESEHASRRPLHLVLTRDFKESYRGVKILLRSILCAYAKTSGVISIKQPSVISMMTKATVFNNSTPSAFIVEQYAALCQYPLGIFHKRDIDKLYFSPLAKI